MPGELDDKIVLVSGASRGIGYAAALEAARRGAHVIAAARTVGGLEELDDAIRSVGSTSTLVPLDLADFPAIDRLGQAIAERWGRLDGLVGNAAQLGSITPVPHLDPAEFEKVLTINVTANFRLIRALDAPLRQAEAGRAVFVSSGAGRNPRPYWGLYAASKAALDALVTSYAGEVAQTNMRVNLYSPGRVRTAMRAKAAPGEDPATLPTPAEAAVSLIDLISPRCSENGRHYDLALNGFVPG